MLPENKTIRGLWIGKSLTNIQKLCIRSFQDNGHDFELFTYDRVDNLPSGVKEKSAHDILPWKERERFQNDANFSDYFRSKLTYFFGGWYVDMDIVCLAPFDFEDSRVFVSEYQFGGPDPLSTTPLVNGCIIKIPEGDPMTAAILQRILVMDTKNCGWIDVGPAQYRWGVEKFGYQKYIQHPEVFDSLWPKDLHTFANGEPPTGWIPSNVARAIHLRTSYWKPENNLYPDGNNNCWSYFEFLKRRHGI